MDQYYLINGVMIAEDNPYPFHATYTYRQLVKFYNMARGKDVQFHVYKEHPGGGLTFLINKIFYKQEEGGGNE